MDAQDQRDELFERAKIGEITGEQADAEAIRLGLGKLSHRPGPDEFRAEAETQWTLPMAVAWIAYLDLEEVREWSAPYRAECFDWHWQRWRRGLDGPIYEGWHLEQRSKPTLSLLGIGASIDRADDDSRLKMSIREAEKALWVALRTDCFRASGLNENGRRVEIPPLEWNDLKLILGRGDREELCFDFDRVAYHQVLLPAAPIRGLWREQVESVERLPPIIPPTGFGYMPLFCAAQWIATKGGTVDIDPGEVESWRPAYGQLVAAISSGVVKIVGVQGHQTLPVPAYLFVGIRVDHPYVEPTIEMILSNELVLRSYPYIDDENWRKGFDDALIDRAGDRWVRLSVEKADIARLWPFGPTPETSTGLPGRPALSRHLIEQELQRRGQAKELEDKVGKQAEVLVAWLVSAHPNHARPTPRVVENYIRDEYKRLKSMK